MRDYQTLAIRIGRVDTEWTVHLLHTNGASLVSRCDEQRAFRVAKDFAARLGLRIWVSPPEARS